MIKVKHNKKRVSFRIDFIKEWEVVIFKMILLFRIIDLKYIV